jgi:hypothetical protein
MSIRDLKSKLTAKNLKDFNGSKGIKKSILGVVIVLLLGALGLEVNNKDFDMEKLVETGSFAQSAIQRDESGNLLRDESGKLVLPGSKEQCIENNYNCIDFKTQKEAQDVFDACKSFGSDPNRLDGNKDGIACQDLPKK